jgi:hypothetical protein
VSRCWHYGSCCWAMLEPCVRIAVLNICCWPHRYGKSERFASAKQTA